MRIIYIGKRNVTVRLNKKRDYSAEWGQAVLYNSLNKKKEWLELSLESPR